MNVLGSFRPAPSRLYASSLNEALARALDADVVLAGYWPADSDVEGLAERLAIAASGYVAAGLRAALARRRLSVVAAVP